MRKILGFIFGFWLGGLLLAAQADTFPLADGASVTGDIVTIDDIGVKFRLGDGKYTDRISWTKFSQDGLKQLSANAKIKPLVEPFIEIPAADRPQKPEVNVQPATRLDLPPKQSFFGALFSAPLGILAVLLIYAANIYAGYEIATIRARPKAVVMGVAAALPIVGPIIFLILPMQEAAAPDDDAATVESVVFAMAGQPEAQAEGQAAPGSLPTGGVAQANNQIFQRGKFTFNRRFVETRFAGFFGATRSPAAAKIQFIIKTTAGQFVVERITRMAASEMQVEVVVGETRQEILIPLADIQEVQLNQITQ